MVDLVTQVAQRLAPVPPVLQRLGLTPRTYCVATIHRASNTDDVRAFERLISGLRGIDMPIVFPVHPRTREIAKALRAGENDNIIACEPLPYMEMAGLVARCAMVFTDSGGLQKEAFVLKVPCVTLREETEWGETLEDGWNVLAGTDPSLIVQASRRMTPVRQGRPYGEGDAAARIADALAGGEAQTRLATQISVDGPSESTEVSSSSSGYSSAPAMKPKTAFSHRKLTALQ